MKNETPRWYRITANNGYGFRYTMALYAGNQQDEAIEAYDTLAAEFELSGVSLQVEW